MARAFIARRPEALDEAYVAYAGLLYGVAYRVLENREDARDCVHDVLLRIWAATRCYRQERGTLRGFLVVAVRNDAISRRRSAARHHAIERRVQERMGTQTEFQPEIADHIETERLRRALDTLPVEQRAVFERIYLQYKTQAEVARELGIPIGTVKSRVTVGLRRLHAAMQPNKVVL
ncbi:MAG: RNA polymerase sigma factor [Vulcanimicrobiaceae bacterium]